MSFSRFKLFKKVTWGNDISMLYTIGKEIFSSFWIWNQIFCSFTTKRGRGFRISVEVWHAWSSSSALGPRLLKCQHDCSIWQRSSTKCDRMVQPSRERRKESYIPYKLPFKKPQNAILKAGISRTDDKILREEEKIQQVVQQCRTSHNGPIATLEELEKISKTLKKYLSALRDASLCTDASCTGNLPPRIPKKIILYLLKKISQ